MLYQREKAIMRSLHSIFCKEEENMSKDALGVLCDGYGIEGTIVVLENGRNKILCSSVLNMDRLNRLNAQLGRITCRGGKVYSYDGVYDYHREYPLILAEENGFGAILLENNKAVPAIPLELIEFLAFIVRHEMLKRRAAESALFDLNTNLKNRDGLYQVFKKEGIQFYGGFLCCIRLKNRSELLNVLKCGADLSLSTKITNIIIRQLRHQIYRIGVDLWVWLVPKCPSDGEEQADDYEGLCRKELDEVLSCLTSEISGSVFSIAYTDVKEDLLYSLFLTETATQNDSVNEVCFIPGVNEGDLKAHFGSRQGTYTEEFHQETDLYNTHWTRTSVEDEPPVSTDGVYQQDGEESFGEAKDSATFDASEEFVGESESGIDVEVNNSEGNDFSGYDEATEEENGDFRDDSAVGDDDSGEDDDGCLII